MTQPLDGRALQDALQSLRRFHTDCALMLRHADTLIEADPLRLEGSVGSQSMIEQSYSINQADQWAPDFVARMYRRKDHPDLVVWFSMLLLARRDPSWPIQREPLASVGWARLNAGVNDGYKQMWRARTAWWTPNLQPGVFVDAPRKEELAKQVRVMARPLADITDGPSLEALMVEPLRTELAGVCAVTV